MRKINSALISVFDKGNLDVIVNKLDDLGVKIYSTGGTQTFIEGLGIDVTAVEDVTNFPSILGGRVKTLHPKVFGGILNRRDTESDQEQVLSYDIPHIDLVIVDLYPFEETIASGASHEDSIEKIDIGGISLIRAAAKNYKDVVIVPSKKQYQTLIDLLTINNGATDLIDRKKLAAEAFAISSHYDTAIFNYLNEGSKTLRISEDQYEVLRYGENPHQTGIFYGDLAALFTKVHGKELSYNNLLDVDAAVNLMTEFSDEEPTFAILKHNNACGLSTRKNIKQAYIDALAGDPLSAFGGVLISNCPIDEECASEIDKLFCEIVIAPDYLGKSLEILGSKKNRIILIQKETPLPSTQIRTALNGLLFQDKDKISDRSIDFKLVTNKEINKEQADDLVFASKLAKHTKSNTIVIAKNKQLIASGTGQTSRIDALKQAIDKAINFDFDLKGAVLASDAFFPFADSVEIANKAGIVAIVQPGGSIKDQLSIDYCNANDMAMVFTGIRHFKH